MAESDHRAGHRPETCPNRGAPWLGRVVRRSWLSGPRDDRTPFTRPAIVGAGLIGASVQQARRGRPGVEIVTLDAGHDLSAVAGADPVVLAPYRANIAPLDNASAVTAATA